MKKYSTTIVEYVRVHAPGTPVKQLTEETNKALSTAFTASEMKSIMSNHGIKNGRAGSLQKKGCSSTFPKEIWDFILKSYKGIGHQEMVDMIYARFGVKYKISQIAAFYKNHNLNSGLTGRFSKGHTPANKGKKGYCAPGCEKSWFQSGHIPINHQPVGSERVDRDGYTMIKTAEPNVWQLKHKLIWENTNGKVPTGHIVIFLDGDKRNFDIANLALISQAENAVINHAGLRSISSSLTQVGINVAKIKLAIAKRSKSKNKHNCSAHG